jgi:hypothetical protein
MIYCPNCGTANRDGSSFCNQCGHKFGGSKTTCPACGSDNPIENLFCDACGAKLAPLVTRGVEEKPGVKGLSLPTKPIDDEPLPEDEDTLGEVLPAEEGEEDIPDWLARLRATIGPENDSPQEGRDVAAPQPNAAPLFESLGEDADEEVPEWLQQLKESEPSAPEEEEAVESPALEEEATVAAEAAEPEGLITESDALPEQREVAAPQPDAAPLFESSGEDADEETPEWLQQLKELEPSAPDEEEATVAAEAAESEEEIAESAKEVVEETAAEAEFDDKALADSESLREMPGQVETSPEAAQPPEGIDILAIPALSEPAETAALIPEEDEGDLAAWLQQEGPVILEADEGEEDRADTIVFQPEETSPRSLPPSDIPAWLETLAPEGAVLPEELGRAFTPAGKPSPEDVGLERAEIPSWLEELRPGHKKEEGPIEETIEAAGLLGGLRGALKMVGAVDPAPSQRTRPASTPASATAAHAEMLTRLLNEPASALVKPRVVPTAARRSRGLPWLAFLLLFAAVLIPFFVPGLVPGGNTVPGSEAAADLSSQIQSLKQGDVVLVSFDYDPGASTELDWPVRVILDDLRAKGANLLITSVTPTGPGLAARFDMGGMQTVLLGYLPGQEMGLQRLATGLEGVFSVDFQGNPVSEAPLGVHSLKDVALIITAASSQEPVRWWVEQVKTQMPSTPMGAVVSGAIEPVVRPYYASGQLVGLVSGWVGGQAYRQAAAPTEAASKEDIAAMEAQSLAHLTIALLIVLGNIAYWGRRLFGRQP